MLRRGSTPPGSSTRSKSKKKRNSTGSSSKRRWPFSRKSSKTISQQSTPNSGDDVLIVSPSPIGGGDLEFSIPGSYSSTRSSDSPRRSTSVESEGSGVNADESVFVESGEQRVGDIVAEHQQGSSDTARESHTHTHTHIHTHTHTHTMSIAIRHPCIHPSGQLVGISCRDSPLEILFE